MVHLLRSLRARRPQRSMSLALLATLLMPMQLFAQAPAMYHHFLLIDVGTFGGPQSFGNGPLVPTITNNGTYAGEAETAIPDPFAPNCQDPDCLVQHAQEWRDGVVRDLGTLPGVNLSSGSTWVADSFIGGVSENGLIDPLLGTPEMRAVVWTKNGRIIDLGTLGGGYESFTTGVNNRGQAVGWSYNLIADPFSMWGGTTQMRGFFWDNGAMRDLGTLGGPDNFPEAMNDGGQVIGWSYTNSTPNANNGAGLVANGCPPNAPTQDPYLWENGRIMDLGGFGGSCGEAVFINNRGQIVGTSNLAGNQAYHAFLWQRGVLQDLGTLGGNNSEAYWITDSGLVVGRADVSMQNTNHHAFLLKNGVMIDLGIVGSCLHSTAVSVNSRAQVVGDIGDCPNGAGSSFFSEDGEPMVDINTLVLPGSNLTVGDTFSINERGEVAGEASLPNGDQHAVVLIPCDQNHADVRGCDFSLVAAAKKWRER